ncbi:ABC transporter permease [Pseudonocardiaceae bacterium YIM PH 21723]|nr:ABC transporter permease [Pseudonocardiaceae bacterium YIM PH 21723]
MQAATLETPPAPAQPSYRSWSRAIGDITSAWQHRELWGYLGWQDIKQRYRRSVIGPLWITISMAVTACALGLLYSAILGSTINTFLPYITVGFIIWNFINNCVLEGTEAFIANEGLIKHLPAPISVHIFRTVWRQVLFFAHNLVIYFIVAAIFFKTMTNPYQLIEGGSWNPGIGWTVLLAIPAFVLLVVNSVWVTMLFGIIATRFRDIPPVIGSLMQLLFFMTPIVWFADALNKKNSLGGARPTWQKYVVESNPLYHYVDIVRAPLLGQQIHWHSWAIVGGLTIFGWGLALLALRNYRARVSYWV